MRPTNKYYDLFIKSLTSCRKYIDILDFLDRFSRGEDTQIMTIFDNFKPSLHGSKVLNHIEINLT
jgi:hypothetical protein